MPIVLPSELVVSVSGFRGRVGSALTPALVSEVSSAFGAFLREKGWGREVLLGRDSRTSGPMFARAAAAGLESVGCAVTDLGIVPTPTLLLAVEESDASGGVVVTASHNPAEWNALKLAGPDGIVLDAAEMEAFLRFLGGREVERAPWNALGAVGRDTEAIPRHIERILSLPILEVLAIRERGLHVALDCVRGAGGSIMPSLLESLGCRVSGIGLEIDGRFPRDPEPTAENLRELGDLVRAKGADVGFAVDPDVDRLSLVDEMGRAVGEDLTLALACAVVLRRTPGLVVTNLSTSQVVDDVAHSFGSEVSRAPVGEIHVARRMRSDGAVVGGEGNGGVIFPQLHYTRDAPVGAALVLQHLIEEDRPLSALVSSWPSYRIVKEKISFPREAIGDAFGVLAQDLRAPEMDTSDGIRLAWPRDKVWLHVRSSGTEPVVRLVAESPDEGRSRGLVQRARDLLSGVV